MYIISFWFLIFFIFSIIGYFAEVLFCYIADGKLVNRGFLHGPYCPIYGFGALLIILFLSPYNDDPIVLFILSVVFTSILEYFTSWLMEKLFNDRWWDYSHNFGNINGRVCFFNSLCFGVGALLINYLLFPLISKFILILSSKVLIILSLCCFVGIFIDFIITTNLAFKLKRELLIVKEYLEEVKINIPKIEFFDKKVINKLEKYKKVPNHFINAFPNLKVKNIKEIKTLKELYLKYKKERKSK